MEKYVFSYHTHSDWLVVRYIILILGVSFKFIEPFLDSLDARFTIFLGCFMLLSLISFSLSRPLIRQRNNFLFFYILAIVLLILGEPGIPYCIFMAAALFSVGIKRGIKIIFFSSLFFLLFTCFVCYYFEINSEYNLINGNTIRYSLGFSSPNTPSIYLLTILSTYFCWKKKITVFYLFIFIVLFLGFNYFTKSRTMLYTALITLIFYFPILFLLKWKKAWIVVSCFPVLFFLITILLTMFFHNTQINNLLSGRLELFYQYLTTMNPTIFSKNKELSQFYLDNLFLFYIYRRTILAFVVLLFISFLGTKRIYNYFSASFFGGFSLAFFLLMLASVYESFLDNTFNICFVILIYAICCYTPKKDVLLFVHSLIKAMPKEIGEKI